LSETDEQMQIDAKLMVFYMIVAENMVLITRIWNRVMNSEIGYVYAVLAVNHYLKGFLT